MRTILFRLIGILEIAGGLYGSVEMIQRLLPLGSTQNSVLALIGLAVFAFVLVAGVLLLEGSEQGVRLSRWAQLLQLPLIATPVFSYALHSGAFAHVFATLQSTPRLRFHWDVGTQHFVLAVAGPAVSRLGINLLALGSWLVLRWR
jgi:hypothetical protein